MRRPRDCGMLAGFPPQQLQSAFDFCKANASVDGAFPDALLRSYFDAAWQLCAEMIGYEPPGQIQERIQIDDRGLFRLSRMPTGPVEVFAGYTRVAVLTSPFKGMGPCDPSLCCFCDLTVRYPVGSASCEISPRFLMAVARLFAYLVENRGDSEMDEQVLAKSGAKAFLAPDLTYAA